MTTSSVPTTGSAESFPVTHAAHHREPSEQGRGGGAGASPTAEPFPSRQIDSWPKRDDASRKLEVSKSTIRRLEARGVLQTARDAEGATRIDPESLARAARELGVRAASPTHVASDAPSEALPNPGVAYATPQKRVGSDSVAREAEIFAALSAGRTPIQAVIELGVSSADVARALHAWEQLMAPWEPPVSAVAAHIDALTAFARDLQAFVVALEARVARLEAQQAIGAPSRADAVRPT